VLERKEEDGDVVNAEEVEKLAVSSPEIISATIKENAQEVLPIANRCWPDFLEIGSRAVSACISQVRPSSILGASLISEDEMSEEIERIKLSGQGVSWLATEVDSLSYKYELLATEKSWVAARTLGIDRVSLTVVCFASDCAQQLCLAILNPDHFIDIELARILKRIREEYCLTLSEIANLFGYEAGSWASKRLKLLEVNPRVQAQMERNVPIAERLTCHDVSRHVAHLPKGQQWYKARELVKWRKENVAQ
jgi:hypothetical protein